MENEASFLFQRNDDPEDIKKELLTNAKEWQLSDTMWAVVKPTRFCWVNIVLLHAPYNLLT